MNYFLFKNIYNRVETYYPKDIKNGSPIIEINTKRNIKIKNLKNIIKKELIIAREKYLKTNYKDFYISIRGNNYTVVICYKLNNYYNPYDNYLLSGYVENDNGDLLNESIQLEFLLKRIENEIN